MSGCRYLRMAFNTKQALNGNELLTVPCTQEVCNKEEPAIATDVSGKERTLSQLFLNSFSAHSHPANIL